MTRTTAQARARVVEVITAAGAAGMSRKEIALATGFHDDYVTQAIWEIGTSGDAPIRRVGRGHYVAAAFENVAVDPSKPAKTAPAIIVGSMEHQLLLACRAGGMTGSQIKERWGAHAGTTAQRLARRRLLKAPSGDSRECEYTITEAGRALVAPDGPLSRRKTLTTYCQL